MVHGRATLLAILIAAAAIPRPVTATDRFYPNIAATSPNGRWRLEAASPDNTPDRIAPFAANFIYVMHDTTAAKPVWTRAQPKTNRYAEQAKREGSPIAAFVHDSGAVVVWTAFNDLLVLDAKGVVTLEVPICDSIPAAEKEAYVHWTTGGFSWSGDSHWYFFTANEKLHFGIRTRWDRRILLCTSDAKLVADEAAVHEGAIVGEREHILSTLRKASAVAKQWGAKGIPEYSTQHKSPWEEVPGLGAVIKLAERMDLKDAVPLLLDVESLPYFGNSCSQLSETVPEGQLFIATYSYDSLRSAVQLAIRRLGGTPKGLPTKELFVAKADNQRGDGYRPKTHKSPRVDRVPLVTTSMGAKEVADTIGEPDYVVWAGVGEWRWEYDIDTATPFTFQVLWKNNKLVRTERLHPPVWTDGTKRDMQKR
jgi:hypothetical protein